MANTEIVREKDIRSPYSFAIYILSLILGLFTASLSVSIVGGYSLLDTLVFNYILLYVSVLSLLVTLTFKFRLKFRKVNIIFLSVSIFFQIIFIIFQYFIVMMIVSLLASMEGLVLLAFAYRKHRRCCVKKNLSLPFILFVSFVSIVAFLGTFTLGSLAYAGAYYTNYNRFDGRSYKHIQYGEHPVRNNMSIYVPYSAENRESNAAIVFLHPGAWKAGYKEICASDAKRKAEDGYITMTMNYTFLTERNNKNMDDIIDDITLALNKLKEFSNDKNLNINKIALCGYSAGAHLSMLYAYKYREKSPFEISFIAAKAGPALMYRYDYWTPSIAYTAGVLGGGLKSYSFAHDSDGRKLSKAEMVRKPEAVEALKRLSPSEYLSSDCPPTLLCYGKKDVLIPQDHLVQFKALLDKANMTYKVYNCEGCSHYFFENADALHEYYLELDAWALKYFGY